MGRKIRELIEQPQLLHRMSQSASQLAPKNAAALVVDTMEKYAK